MKVLPFKREEEKPRLLVNQKTGVVSGEGDLGDRAARIRTSLEKINRLMAELKKMSGETK